MITPSLEDKPEDLILTLSGQTDLEFQIAIATQRLGVATNRAKKKCRLSQTDRQMRDLRPSPFTLVRAGHDGRP